MEIKVYLQKYEIKFKHTACVFADATTIDRVDEIWINEVERTAHIIKNDEIIGCVLYEYVKEFGCYLYDENDEMNGHDEIMIVHNGKLNEEVLLAD